jgi:hypothetical protein
MRCGGRDPHAYCGVALIEDWVFEDNVVRFLEHVSSYIGYAYDVLDETALTGALEDTDDESKDRWFSYPWPERRRSWYISPRPLVEAWSAFAWRATSTRSWRPGSRRSSTCSSNTGNARRVQGAPGLRRRGFMTAFPDA